MSSAVLADADYRAGSRGGAETVAKQGQRISGIFVSVTGMRLADEGVRVGCGVTAGVKREAPVVVQLQIRVLGAVTTDVEAYIDPDVVGVTVIFKNFPWTRLS